MNYVAAYIHILLKIIKYLFLFKIPYPANSFEIYHKKTQNIGKAPYLLLTGKVKISL